MPFRMLGPYAALLVLNASLQPAAGALFRGSSLTSHNARGSKDQSKVARKAVANSSASSDIDRTHRVQGLVDISQDLVASKAKDDVSLKKLESQIVSLVHERDAVKRDEARKTRELAFLHTEIRRAQGTASDGAEQGASEGSQTAALDEAQALTATSGTASAGTDAAASTAAEAEADAAIASAEQVVSGAAASATSAASSGNAAAAATSSDTGRSAAAAASSASTKSVAKKAKTEAEMEAEAEARMRAEAEERARKKIEAEEAQKRKAEEEKRQAEEARAAKRRQAEEAQEKERRAKEAQKNKIADSADDSFKQFMKEEDGEDQMGDSDYEDSANALAGAIGWNRQEIEHKADSAVKQLTEAIGGKKSIQAVQGMMAGIR